MRRTLNRMNFVVTIAVVISMIISTFTTTPVRASSGQSSAPSTIQSSEIQSLNVEGRLGVGAIALSSQVSNNLSTVKTYTEITCIENTDIVIASGEVCTLEAGTYSFNSITIENGGAIIAQSDTTSNAGVIISTGSITIASGGLISADGTGYTSTSGSGAGINGTGAYHQASGAGHGG